MTLYRTELERYLTAGGAEVQVMDGKNDQAEQTNQINNFISQGVDVMIINLVMSSSAPTIADICHDAGIPAVFINREPDKEEQDRWEAEGMQCTYVGADASQSGTMQGELIVDLADSGDADGDGVVRYAMLQGDPENIDAQLRTEFSVKALVDAGIEVDELFMQRGDWDQIKGQELAANALAAHGDKLDVIFCNNDAMALGAIQAVQAAGRTVGGDIYLVGVDALVEALDAIEAGTMTGTVFNDHLSQARTAADKASDFMNGIGVPVYVRVDYVKVTPDNAAEIKAMVA
jgi:methyl-galactoside transport system substrate-binding protein